MFLRVPVCGFWFHWVSLVCLFVLLGGISSLKLALSFLPCSAGFQLVFFWFHWVSLVCLGWFPWVSLGRFPLGLNVFQPNFTLDSSRQVVLLDLDLLVRSNCEELFSFQAIDVLADWGKRLWLKNRYPKWNPGKWKHGQIPAQP